MRYEITINNETIDDELIMLDLDDFEEDELNTLVNILSKKTEKNTHNMWAFYKVQEFAKNYGIELKIKE